MFAQDYHNLGLGCYILYRNYTVKWEIFSGFKFCRWSSFNIFAGLIFCRYTHSRQLWTVQLSLFHGLIFHGLAKISRYTVCSLFVTKCEILWFNSSLALSLSVLGLIVVYRAQGASLLSVEFCTLGFASFTLSVCLFLLLLKLSIGQELCYSDLSLWHCMYSV